MGFMIQLMFEPSILGVERVWCTSCGCVCGHEDLLWRTDSMAEKDAKNEACVRITKVDGSEAGQEEVSRYHWITDAELEGSLPLKKSKGKKKKKNKRRYTVRWDGSNSTHEQEESPHLPFCPRCGENNVLGKAKFDGLCLRSEADVLLYPRWVSLKRISAIWNAVKKPLKTIWREVEPYMTKKGKMSIWKADKGQQHIEEKLYDGLSKKWTSTPMPLWHIYWKNNRGRYLKMSELCEVYGEHVTTSRWFRDYTKGKGLVFIGSRTTWHGYRKTSTKRPMRSSCAGFGFEGEPMFLHDSEVDDPKWVSIDEYDDILIENNLMMNRGSFVLDKDIESETYGCAYWYDPKEKEYVQVSNLEDGWYACSYDESQGSDESDDSGIPEPEAIEEVSEPGEDDEDTEDDTTDAELEEQHKIVPGLPHPVQLDLDLVYKYIGKFGKRRALYELENKLVEFADSPAAVLVLNALIAEING